MRYNFIHFRNLPILAKIFWKVPKYLPDNPAKESFNKIIGIYGSNFKAVCSFTHKTDALEKNFIINSHFMFSSEKLRIEETCKYSKMDTTQQFRIVYSIIEKSQEERMFIFEKEHEDKIRLLPRNIQDSFREINTLLEENKDKCVIS
jgi:hypothetical protein